MITALPIEYTKLSPSESLTIAIGSEAVNLAARYREAIYQFRTAHSTESLNQKFERSALTWKEQTRFSSSPSRIILNPSYQQIIAMGPSVTPLILKKMQSEPQDWFHALQTINGINPIDPKHYGNIELMTEDWIEWGKAQRYVD
jgi:hypothetical protein